MMKRTIVITTVAALALIGLLGFAVPIVMNSLKKDGEAVVAAKLPSNPIPEKDMISIPAGTFLMGNSGIGDDATDSNLSAELPQHSVYLSAYSIGKYEVTRGQYRKFMEAGGYSTKAYWSDEGWQWKETEKRVEPSDWAPEDWGSGQPFTQTDNHPVVGVTYYEAEAFCNWAGGHLPTEAQWEKAARWDAATSHPNVYPWGDVWDAEKCNNLDDHNSAGGGYGAGQAAPVGSYPSDASPSGCQDMAGNVEEWCKDWYQNTYYSQSPTSDPQGPATGGYRVLRGGSWGSTISTFYLNIFYDLRCAYRSCDTPNYYDVDFGFRLAR
ncbi:MAG: formylglycine-generating enzyme family protein [Armatimonadetes bacterium]|nr:formylglycine-generating enzyme family protein [Armatimonadota bacterium]